MKASRRHRRSTVLVVPRFLLGASLVAAAAGKVATQVADTDEVTLLGDNGNDQAAAGDQGPGGEAVGLVLPGLQEALGAGYDALPGLSVEVGVEANSVKKELSEMKQEVIEQLAHKKAHFEQRLSQQSNLTAKLRARNKLKALEITRLESDITTLGRRERELQSANKQINQELQSMQNGLGAAEKEFARSEPAVEGSSAIEGADGFSSAPRADKPADESAVAAVEGSTSASRAGSQEDMAASEGADEAEMDESQADTEEAAPENGEPAEDGAEGEEAGPVPADGSSMVDAEDAGQGEDSTPTSQSQDGQAQEAEEDEEGSDDDAAPDQAYMSFLATSSKVNQRTTERKASQGMKAKTRSAAKFAVYHPSTQLPSAAEEASPINIDDVVPVGIQGLAGASAEEMRSFDEPPAVASKGLADFARAPSGTSVPTPAAFAIGLRGRRHPATGGKPSLARRLHHLLDKVEQMERIGKHAEGKLVEVYRSRSERLRQQYEKVRQESDRLDARRRSDLRRKARLEAEVARLEKVHGPLLRLLRRSLARIERMADMGNDGLTLPVAMVAKAA